MYQLGKMYYVKLAPALGILSYIFSYSVHCRVRLADCVSRGIFRLHVEMVSVNTVSKNRDNL